MSLLTPPRTAHRSEKENRFQSASSSRVVWSQHQQIHDLTISPKPLKCCSAKRGPPKKSILKSSSYPLLPLLDAKPREETPEPEDPLMDLHYLEGPVIVLVSPLATMQELNEAYGRLMSRLRAAVVNSTDADASWPLFQPIRQCKLEFVAAIVRDLRRALEDPAEKFPNQPQEDESMDHDAKAASCLPSPKQSPKKKRGMSAEQVKYARDLCTTSHSAMKFLAMIMGLPAIYKLFTDTQLRELLTEVLAIPSADSLPTPNARKTCALAIWVIQVQRLSRSILLPLSIRVAHVVRRGIDGELGKEGKKGSASDGLKAIHDLCVFQPTTFIPAFTNILDSVLNNLLASTLTLRQQACHALSGIVLGVITIPRSSSIHNRISSIIANYITQVPNSPRTASSSASPSKLAQEAPILRTLRATLAATDPAHVAQGPVWALIVLACFVVLLGPTLIHNNKIFRSLSTFLSLSMRHKKSSVRAIGCMVWRCVAWVYFLPSADNMSDNSLALGMLKDKRDSVWRALMHVVDLQTGMAIIAAVLGDETIDSDEGLVRTMAVLENMAAKETNISDVIDTMKRLVSLETGNVQWKVNKLLISSIFTANPGLLTAEYKALSGPVNDMLVAQLPLEDIRYLTRDEIAQEWVFDGMMKLWRRVLASLKKFDESEIPGMAEGLLGTWQGLLNASASYLQDIGEEDSIIEFARRAADVLVDILEDTNLDLIYTRSSHKVQECGSGGDHSGTTFGRTNSELRLQIVSEMWRIAYIAFPEACLRRAGERLLGCLMKIEDELVESNSNARLLWVALCVKALRVCDTDAMKTFWGFETGGSEWDWTEEVRNIVWRASVENWSNQGCSWEGATVLLAVPFTSPRAQILGNEDTKKWEECLQYAIDKALDYGLDSMSVLDATAGLVLEHQDSSSHSVLAQAADLLMSHLDMKEMREVPDTLMEFVNNTMRLTYPPELGNQDISRWMIRTLTDVIEHCPTGLGSQLLELVQDGICVWVADDNLVWSLDDYEYEIVPLYAQVLFRIQSLRPSMENLEKFTNVIESGFSGRDDKPQLVKDQFQSFWSATYASWETLGEEWPEGIQRCLGIDVEVTTRAELSYPSSPLPPSSPTFSTCELSRACTPEITAELETPTTPITALPTSSSKPPYSRKSTPLERGFLEFPPTIAHTSPLCIRTPTTPITPKCGKKRAWRTSSAAPGSTTPKAKRRKTEAGRDKENASPGTTLGYIPSVAERIAKNSPLGAIVVPSGSRRKSGALKRQLPGEVGEQDTQNIEDLAERPSPLKRGRMNGEIWNIKELESFGLCQGSDDSAEERNVALSLLPASPCSQRPRTRWLMESVEVPSFEEVLVNRRLRRATSLESLSDLTAIKTPSTSGGRVIRKMRPSEKSTKKMACISDPFYSSPLPALRLSNVNTAKWVRTASAPAAASSSSDDDPRYGQVTPHHLISPAPKKITDVFDPPSDDPLLPSSPIKAVISRRSAQRRNSAGGVA